MRVSPASNDGTSSRFGCGPAKVALAPYCLAASVVVFLLACKSSSRCEEISEVDLADDEATPEGMTADDVIATTSTPHTAAFRWAAGLSNAVPADSTTVTVSVSRLPSPARHLVTEQVGNTEDDLDCGSSLIVPIRLRLETSDGALDDDFEADLVADLRSGVPSSAELFLDLDFDELAGTLRPIEPGFGELFVRFGSSERGDLGLRVERRDGGNAVESFRSLGGWGTDD